MSTGKGCGDTLVVAAIIPFDPRDSAVRFMHDTRPAMDCAPVSAGRASLRVTSAGDVIQRCLRMGRLPARARPADPVAVLLAIKPLEQHENHEVQPQHANCEE